MTQATKTKMDKGVDGFSKTFFEKYNHTDDIEKFFNSRLPQFAEKILEKGVDLEKEIWNFVDEYRVTFGGYNATYGNIYHWLIDFAAVVLGVNAFELRSSVVYK